MPGTRGPVPVPLEQNGRDLTQQLLDKLDEKEPLQTNTDFPDVSQGEIKAALDRLASRSMLVYETQDKEQVVLTPEGQKICDEGSHEYKVWDAVKKAGKMPVKDLTAAVGAESAKVGQGNAFRVKWIKKDGDSLVPLVDAPEDSTRKVLQGAQDSASIADAKVLADYKKRKLVTTAKVIHYIVKKGPKYAKEIQVEVTDLTPDMLENGSWQTANWKPYNFKSLGAPQQAGALHPLNKVREEFVDSGFWNFDALFVPQQHPARDMQDTFYVSDPPLADPPRADPEADAALDAMESLAPTDTPHPTPYETYFANVRAVHETGKYGSIGYRYPWNPAEAARLVLRTHTTAVSTYCLHRLARDPRPCRYFSIDRVFRNESVDATHLAEFHQIEGVIADYNLTLGGLMAFLEGFFGKLGITNLRFKPAYNPYTEPSMEVFGYHQGLGKWVEIGNSGMFRPEMLEAMGLPEDLRVYGFGLSLERPTMIKYKLSNIRDLLGHKVDLGFIEGNAAVRLDKD
ncbi:tRNA synthetases class II core domain (F)-domain-containing protein [Elsinoe ampelina]|uniref:phenylalanine--tRNA ligase n=1 Tax=Elsinoe ampelina TaxID=302913 RepID=A0A6A6GGH2_9PEZI|nr:tRNA synthetases class II core domain (F)-domain-containing protein [Elsinoe ampelina]